MLRRYIPGLLSRTFYTKRCYSEGYQFASLVEESPKGNGSKISSRIDAGEFNEQELTNLYNEAPDVTGAVLLIQRQDTENALKTYKTIVETRQPTLERALSALLTRFRHKKLAQEACKRFEDVEKYNLDLNEILLYRFLQVAVDAENVKMLNKLLSVWSANDSMVDNTEEIGTLFITGFSRAKDFNGIAKAYTAGIAKAPPTNAILGKLINACKEHGANDRIQYLWRDAIRYKVELNGTNFTRFFQASIDQGSEGFRKSVLSMFTKAAHTDIGATATFLITELAAIEDLESILTVYSEYRELQTPTMPTFCAMVNACRKLLKPSRVVPFIGDLLNTDVKKSRIAVGSFTQAITDASDGPSAMRLYETAQAGQISLDEYDYSNIIKVLAQYVNVDTAIDCMFLAEKKGITPSVHVITTLVNACGNIGSLQKGRALHEKIKRIGEADYILQCALIGMYAKCNSPVEAQTIIDQALKEKNVDKTVFSATMDAYGRLKQEKQLIELFTEMKKRHVVDDDFIVTGKINALHLIGKSDLAVQQFKKFLASGNSPNRHTCLQLVKVYAESGRPELAEQTLERYIGVPNIPTLLTIMKGYGPTRIRKAQAIFAKILELNPTHQEAFDLMHSYFIEAKLKREQLSIEKMMAKITREGTWNKTDRANN